MAKQIKKQVPVYLPKATHTAFKKIAAKQGESMTKVIEQLINAKIESEAANA